MDRWKSPMNAVNARVHAEPRTGVFMVKFISELGVLVYHELFSPCEILKIAKYINTSSPQNCLKKCTIYIDLFSPVLETGYISKNIVKCLSKGIFKDLLSCAFKLFVRLEFLWGWGRGVELYMIVDLNMLGICTWGVSPLVSVCTYL